VIGLNVLEARGLGKRYGDQWALRDCTLALPAGRVVGLVGPNGAGKTTLLQLAVGMLAPSAGEIAVFGRDPREAKSVLPRVGFVAQDSPLYRAPAECPREAGSGRDHYGETPVPDLRGRVRRARDLDRGDALPGSPIRARRRA
jgi:hypothetical protein